jgi:hypothetical protein
MTHRDSQHAKALEQAIELAQRAIYRSKGYHCACLPVEVIPNLHAAIERLIRSATPAPTEPCAREECRAAAALSAYVEPHIAEHGNAAGQVGSVCIGSKDLLFLAMAYRAARRPPEAEGPGEAAVELDEAEVIASDWFDAHNLWYQQPHLSKGSNPHNARLDLVQRIRAALAARGGREGAK